MNKLIEIKHSFSALKTDVTGIICDHPENQLTAERALARVELLFKLIEATLSRFQSDIELIRLNRISGSFFPASGMLIQVVEEALEAARLTDGMFDPVVMPPVNGEIRRSLFEKYTAIPGGTEVSPIRDCPDWRSIRIDHSGQRIWLPPGCGLELGGIGRGWAIDQACQIIKPFDQYSLDAGGDVRVQGHPVDGEDWYFGVDNPLRTGKEVIGLHLRQGALFTASLVGQKCLPAGFSASDCFDRCSLSARQNGVISATVIAECASRAEILAKAALVAGPVRGKSMIESQPGCRGIIFLNDGSWLSTIPETSDTMG